MTTAKDTTVRLAELERELASAREELDALRATTSTEGPRTLEQPHRAAVAMALEDSERMFRSLFESTSVAVTIRDVSGQKFIDCNDAALHLYGFASREELSGTTPDQLAAPLQEDGTTSIEALRGFVGRALRDGSCSGEWLARRKSGEVFPAAVRITVMLLHDGRRIMQTMIEDISERRRVELAARQQANRDRVLSSISREFVQKEASVATSLALALLGEYFGVERVRVRRWRDGGVHFDAAEEWRASGFSPTPAPGTTAGADYAALVQRMSHPRVSRFDDFSTLPLPDRLAVVGQGADAARAAMVVSLASHRNVVGWIAIESLRGPRVWTEEDAMLLSLAAEIVALGQAEAEAEAETRATEKRYRDLVDRSRDAIFIIDLTGRILFASPACLEIYGYTAEECTRDANFIFETATPEHRGRVRAVFAEISDTKKTGPKLTYGTWRRKDGRIVHTEAVLSSILDEGDNLVAIQAITRDITERKLAEASQQRRAARDELLSDVSRRFLNDDIEAATDATLERLGSTLAAERVSIFAPDGSRLRLRCTHRWSPSGGDAGWESLDAYPFPEGTFVRVGGGPRTPAAEPGANAEIEPWLDRLQRESGRRTMHALLGYGGRVFGLISVRAGEGRAWTDEDASTLRLVGELIGVGQLRRAAEIALAKAREDAVAANLMKSAFLANMSHELRTPLNGVIGMVDLLSTTVLDDRQKRYAEVARASARLLLSVINDILDFSKIEAGKLEVDQIEFAFHEVVEEVANILAASAEEKELELSCHSSAALVMPLIGDPSRLRQVLVNMLSNAVKFTRSGSVSVQAALVEDSADSARVRVEVRDTGVGIRQEAQAKLFQPFVQVDGSSTREHGGTGLGLAICRELIERMAGTIGVISAPGAGSTFWFEVPLAKPVRSTHGEFDFDERLAGVRVLAVDDNATNRDLVRLQLTAAGMFCDTAPDGATALRMLVDNVERAPYGMVVLDHRMPGMDGRELALRIRADGRLRRTRLVMLGSVTRTLGAEDLRAIGVVGYCTKPVWRKQLLRVLRAAFDVPLASGSDDAVSDPSGGQVVARILLVEDSPTNAEVAGEILRAGGYVFDLVTDGARALEAAQRQQYDLVLMDCQLPEMDGYETTRRFRSLEREGRLLSKREGAIPIVALTASALSDDVDRCLAAGMSDHLAKPVDARTVLATVARHLARPMLESPRAELPRSEWPSRLPVANLGRALERMRGDSQLLRRVSAQFAEGSHLARIELRSAVERRDAPAVAFAAHRLKGQAASFDGEACLAAIVALEETIAHERWTAARGALLGLDTELDRLLRAIVGDADVPGSG